MSQANWEYQSFEDWKKENTFEPHSSRVFYPDDKEQLDKVLPDEDTTDLET